MPFGRLMFEKLSFGPSVVRSIVIWAIEFWLIILAPITRVPVCLPVENVGDAEDTDLDGEGACDQFLRESFDGHFLRILPHGGYSICRN
jgi:hypothetical protein